MFNGCGGVGYGGFGYDGFGLGAFMSIIPIIFTGIVIYILFKLFNEQKNNQARDNSEALNILIERYAIGEISEEEYINKRKTLRK